MEFPIFHDIPIMLREDDLDHSKKQLMEYYANESSVYNFSHGSNLYGTDYNIDLHYMKIFEKYLPPDSRLLEFGAGTGKFSTILKDRSQECILTDFSVEMLHANREKTLPRICADTEILPFSDNYFDCCVGITTFGYLPDKKRGLLEIMRVLKPGGKIILIDQNRINLVFALGKLYYLKRRKKNRQPQLSESTIFFYRNLFREVDLSIEKSGTFSWIPHALSKPIVKLLIPIDFILTRIPFLKNYAMRVFLVGQKP